jgi:hypothetical protein
VKREVKGQRSAFTAEIPACSESDVGYFYIVAVANGPLNKQKQNKSLFWGGHRTDRRTVHPEHNQLARLVR